MPHGTPDWGLVGPKATTYGLDDLGEHAVRLGSPHLWDRRGDVVWLTDFRNGRGDVWQLAGPLDGTVQLYAGYARQGAFCVRLMANLGLTVSLLKILPLPVLSRIGLEFSFNVGVNTAYIVGGLRTDDSANAALGEIRYDAGADILQYVVDPIVPTWITFATNLNLWTVEYCPNTLKLVIDPFSTPPQYVRVILNDVTYSLAGIPLHGPATTGVAHLQAQIDHTADGVGDAEISVDNVIVTQNEP